MAHAKRIKPASSNQRRGPDKRRSSSAARSRSGAEQDVILSHGMAVLAEVMQFSAPADNTLSRYFKAHPALGSRARGYIAEAVYTVLRQYSVFAQLAQAGVGALEKRLLLLAFAHMGLDIKHMTNEREWDWLAHVAKFDRQVFAPEIRSNLPPWLWQLLCQRLGQDQALLLAQQLAQTAPLDVRVNRYKTTREAVLHRLRTDGFEVEPTPYAPDGLRFQNKPSLETHPLFLDGSFEVQDEGSQLLPHLLAPKRGEMVVDFCAGAGGKTLALGALMRNTGRLYAFDISAARLARFKPRFARSGLSNVVPAVIASENDAKVKRLAGKIDRVLVDAPCTGLGTLRRNPDLKWRQTESELHALVQKQKNILSAAAKLLKPGGRLVYATCSFLPQENTGVVQDFLLQHANFRRLNVADELNRQQIELPGQAGEDLQLWPHIHGTDGFYACILERHT
jgi:16S rRNA (cytosine967-C5)-methyltransferase